MTLDPTQGVLGSQFFARRVVVLAPVAAEDLVAWYPFREGTGADITAGSVQFGDSTDYSATVNGATFLPSGGVTDIKTGANSGAFEFDGTDDELADVKQLGGTSFTILAQVNTSSANSDFGKIYNSTPAGQTGGINFDVRSGSNTLEANIEDSSTFIIANAPITDPTNGFVQVGLRYDGSTLSLIKDGAVVDSATGSVTVPRNGAKIGHRVSGTGAERFGGIIDGVRLYDTALSNSQISTYNQNTSP